MAFKCTSWKLKSLAFLSFSIERSSLLSVVKRSLTGRWLVVAIGLLSFPLALSCRENNVVEKSNLSPKSESRQSVPKKNSDLVFSKDVTVLEFREKIREAIEKVVRPNSDSEFEPILQAIREDLPLSQQGVFFYELFVKMAQLNPDMARREIELIPTGSNRESSIRGFVDGLAKSGLPFDDLVKEFNTLKLFEEESVEKVSLFRAASGLYTGSELLAFARHDGEVGVLAKELLISGGGGVPLSLSELSDLDSSDWLPNEEKDLLASQQLSAYNWDMALDYMREHGRLALINEVGGLIPSIVDSEPSMIGEIAEKLEAGGNVDESVRLMKYSAALLAQRDVQAAVDWLGEMPDVVGRDATAVDLVTMFVKLGDLESARSIALFVDEPTWKAKLPKEVLGHP